MAALAGVFLTAAAVVVAVFFFDWVAVCFTAVGCNSSSSRSLSSMYAGVRYLPGFASAAAFAAAADEDFLLLDDDTALDLLFVLDLEDDFEEDLAAGADDDLVPLATAGVFLAVTMALGLDLTLALGFAVATGSSSSSSSSSSSLSSSDDDSTGLGGGGT